MKTVLPANRNPFAIHAKKRKGGKIVSKKDKKVSKQQIIKEHLDQ